MLALVCGALAATTTAIAQNQSFEASVVQTGDVGAPVLLRYFTPASPDVNPACINNCGYEGANCDASGAHPVCTLAYNPKGAGGYRGYTENVFNFGVDYGTTFHAIVEFERNAGTSNHAGYLAWITGPVNENDTSFWADVDCAGANQVSCLGNANAGNAVDRPGHPKVGGFSALPSPFVTDHGRHGAWFAVVWNPVVSVGRAPAQQAPSYEVWAAVKTRSSCGVAPTVGDFRFIRTVTTTQTVITAEELGVPYNCYQDGLTFAIRPRFPTTGAGESLGTTYLSANGTCAICVPDPVVVYDLGARALGRGAVEVTWRTSLEDGVTHFDVQRGFAQDGPFETVGQVDAQGEPASYRFLDQPRTRPGAAPGLFYRVLAVETSTEAHPFGPVSVALPAPAPTQRRASP